ncbi:hypothetical protein [Georgenia sp. H159]|uniref:hypothetical protein n=1 Tax=Georgenia sp. H159 TaxID=3076115 RepID=UPI002D777FC2|nr:hypothetical protein [Georgenia sp. H159]
MTATLDVASLTSRQRKRYTRRLASVRRFISEPGSVPRGLLGDVSREDFFRMTPEQRGEHLTAIVDRETADHLAELATLHPEGAPSARQAPRTAAPVPSTAAPASETPPPSPRPAAAPRPVAPRFRPGAPLEAVPVAGSVTGGRALDEQPQPRAEDPTRADTRGAGRDRFTPGETVVRCVGCGEWLPAKPSRSVVARCSAPPKRRKRDARSRATCGGWTRPGESVDG